MPSIVRLARRGDSDSNSASTMPHLSSLVIVSSLCGIVVLGAALCYLNRYFRRLVRQRTRESRVMSNTQRLGVAQYVLETLCLNIDGSFSYQASRIHHIPSSTSNAEQGHKLRNIHPRARPTARPTKLCLPYCVTCFPCIFHPTVQTLLLRINSGWGRWRPIILPQTPTQTPVI